MTATNCKNCGTTHEGSFCFSCGQKRIERRLSLRVLFVELFNSISNIEFGFGKTCLDMVRSPGIMIHKYLQGGTGDYFKPFRFAFIWSTISALIMIYSGVYDAQQSESAALFGQREMTAQELEIHAFIQEKVRSFMSFIILTIVPFVAIGSRLFFNQFRYDRHGNRVKYNYAEHLVINTYITGTSTMIGTPFVIIYAISPQLISSAMLFSLLVNYFFSTYVYWRIFKSSLLGSAWRTFLSIIFSYLLMLFVAMIFGIIAALIWYIPS